MTMLGMEARMLLDLLHVLRRFPSVAMAMALHLVAVGMVLLAPEPPPGPTIVDLPPTIPHGPRLPPSAGGPSSTASTESGRPPREPKVHERPHPTHVRPIEDAVVEPAPSDASSDDGET